MECDLQAHAVQGMDEFQVQGNKPIETGKHMSLDLMLSHISVISHVTSLGHSVISFDSMAS